MQPALQVKGSDSTPSVGPSHIQQVNQATTVKPKLTLETFRGDVTRFQSFWEQFNSTIHENTSIPETDKFKHLKSLLDGQAARVVQGLTLTSANYKHAQELLEDRYGQTQVNISADMDNLLKLNSCTSDKPHQLRYLYDQIRVQIRGREALGVKTETYGQFSIPVIMSKLPTEIRLQVARATQKESSEVWEIEELFKLIQKDIEARETTEQVRATTNHIRHWEIFQILPSK